MNCTDVTTQAELDAAITQDDVCVHVKSPAGAWLFVSGSATVEAYDSATVQAYDSATVRAYDSATVRAYGSATVQAYDSATVRASGSATVQAYDSATVRAYGSATVQAYGSAGVHAHHRAKVTAGPHVAVHLHSGQATVAGGVLIDLTALDLTDPQTWCDHHGVQIAHGRAVLYKALGDDLIAGKGYGTPVMYAIGADIIAPDWRDDSRCGGGLHLSPTAGQASVYRDGATRWLRCTTDLSDLRPISGGTPKCKVRALRVEAEVDAFMRELRTAT